MPSLYLANCTTQNLDFIFRPLGRANTVRYQISAGRQVQVARDVTTEDIAHIIAQHLPYGYVLEAEIKRMDKTIAVEGVFGLDRPVDPASLMLAQEHNDNVLSARGIQLRRAAAIGMRNFLVDSGGLNPEATQVEITQVTKPGDKPNLTEGIRVDPNQSVGIIERRAA